MKHYGAEALGGNPLRLHQAGLATALEPFSARNCSSFEVVMLLS